MISSHSIETLFARSEHHDTAGAERIRSACRACALVLTDEVPQGPGLERALAYLQVSMLQAIHAIGITV